MYVPLNDGGLAARIAYTLFAIADDDRMDTTLRWAIKRRFETPDAPMLGILAHIMMGEGHNERAD